MPRAPGSFTGGSGYDAVPCLQLGPCNDALGSPTPLAVVSLAVALVHHRCCIRTGVSQRRYLPEKRTIRGNMAREPVWPATPTAHRAPEADTIAPDGSEIRLLIDRRHRAEGASLVEVTLPPGQVSRPVWHRQVEEVWYILEGHGQVWRCPPEAEPERFPPISVAAGDALVIPPRWRFQFCAAADEALRFLCFMVPPWPGPDEAQPAEFGGLGPGTV